MRRKDWLTAEETRRRIVYDPETGVFTWILSAGRAKAGTVAGTLEPNGYVVIQMGGKRCGAHRLAWLYSFGVWPTGEIDHINGNRSDNRLCNLRDVSASVNRQNQRRPQAHNKTGDFLGVSWHSRSRKWRASITITGKTVEIGKFTTQEAAYDAYVLRKRAVHEGFML